MKKRWFLPLFLLALPAAAIAQDPDLPLPSDPTFFDRIDAVFAAIVEFMAGIFFFGQDIIGIPFIVLWLIVAATFFTLRMGFINFRAFSHAIYVVRGHFDDPNEPGEVTHFQALSAALSATVGLGNIAGVAVAIQVGGPGAALWMTVAGLLGMTTKFVECTLALKYRLVNPDTGHIRGGPMYTLSRGLSGKLRPLGKVLAIVFAVFCIPSAFGGGNMFQANQSYAAVSGVIPGLPSWLFGAIVAALAGLVIIGGIRRIGTVASALVPVMAAIYTLAALWILLANVTEIPAAIGSIFTEAFSPKAAIVGGFMGTLVQGLRRSAFSNEAGFGSAAIAHAAARTDEPVREGIVALLEPFIDTVVICNMTALIVIITGKYLDPNLQGVEITSEAFATVIGWFPIVLAVATLLFAFSTVISWSYYGQQSWTFLFGAKSLIVYRVLFVIGIFAGSIIEDLGSIIDFTDMMFFSMAFPNLLGCYILSNQVADDLNNYMTRLRTGEMPVYK